MRVIQSICRKVLIKISQFWGRYQKKCIIGCENTHIYEDELYEVFIETYNTLIKNKDAFLIKWEAELQG